MAAEVLAAQGRLLDALRADGYPLAKVPTPVAILHPDQNLLDVDFQPDAGPKAEYRADQPQRLEGHERIVRPETPADPPGRSVQPAGDRKGAAGSVFRSAFFRWCAWNRRRRSNAKGSCRSIST